MKTGEVANSRLLTISCGLVSVAWYFVCFVSTLLLTYISHLSLRRWPEYHHHHHRRRHNETNSEADDKAVNDFTPGQQQTNTGNTADVAMRIIG